MTLDEIRRIISEYDRLLARAVEITSFRDTVTNDVLSAAKLEIEGTTATIKYPHAYYNFDSCEVEIDTNEFDASLLLASEAELDSWRKAKAAARDAEAAALRERRQAEKDREDRRRYDELRRKFEPS